MDNNTIYSITPYLRVVDGKQQSIDMYTTEGGIIYIGRNVCHTPQGQIPMAQEIAAATIEEAFSQYDEAMAVAHQLIKDKLNAPKLVMP